MRLALVLSVLIIAVARGQPCDQRLSATLPEFEVCWAEHYAGLYVVPPEFVEAIIDVESAWRPYVVSSKGAAGLMQLTPSTAFTFGVRNRFLVEDNIRGGVAYLAYLTRQFRGELRLVAAAYYTGEIRVRRFGLDFADPDVVRYVSQVGRMYRKRQRVKRPLHTTEEQGGEH